MDFLNFLFPVKCGICNKISKEAICNNCLNNLYKIEKTKIANVKNCYYNKQLYIFDYKGIIRTKIIQYKFRDKAYLYKFFVQIMLKNSSTAEAEEDQPIVDENGTVISMLFNKANKVWMLGLE